MDTAEEAVGAVMKLMAVPPTVTERRKKVSADEVFKQLASVPRDKVAEAVKKLGPVFQPWGRPKRGGDGGPNLREIASAVLLESLNRLKT